MTQVYDLAKVREREGKQPSPPLLTIRFEDGGTYDIPAVENWPDEALEAAGKDSVNVTDMVCMARALLGERYEDWKAAGNNATHLFEIVGEALGVDPGESSASTDS